MKPAYLLAGGASRRMGADKATLVVEGQPLALRTARLLADAGWQVLVLGGRPLAGFDHLPDEEVYAGPLAALRRAPVPAGPAFVCSCDLPLFRAEVADALQGLCSVRPVVPEVEGRLQPLCAVYPPSAFESLRHAPTLVRLFDWLALTGHDRAGEPALVKAGLDPVWLANANTPEEFARLVGPDATRSGYPAQ